MHCGVIVVIVVIIIIIIILAFVFRGSNSLGLSQNQIARAAALKHKGGNKHGSAMMTNVGSGSSSSTGSPSTHIRTVTSDCGDPNSSSSS